MATPRKHWFRVADSIGDEDWDNDVLATLIRIQARLNTKWARNGLTGEEAGRITLTAGDAMAVTRRSSFARASQLLRRCTHAVSLVLHEDRASVKLEWPKWPEFQGLLSRELPESRPLRKTPPQDARRKTQEEIPEAPPAPAAPRPPPASRGKVPCPEGLSPEAKDRIRTWAAKNGIDTGKLTYGWQAVRDWAAAGNKRQADWEATFRNALRKGWCLEGYTPPAGSPTSRYRSAEDVLADARRKQSEDDTRRASEDPDAIGKLIDMSLRKAGT